jgi:hypothetical protein
MKNLYAASFLTAAFSIFYSSSVSSQEQAAKKQSYTNVLRYQEPSECPVADEKIAELGEVVKSLVDYNKPGAEKTEPYRYPMKDRVMVTTSNNNIQGQIDHVQGVLAEYKDWHAQNSCTTKMISENRMKGNGGSQNSSSGHK